MIPVAQVLELEKQGLSKLQIIHTLQKDGYEVKDIANGFTLADTHKDYSKQIKMNPQNPPGMQPQSIVGNNMPPPPSGMFNAPQAPSVDQETQEIEQLIEEIIDERWKDFEKHFTKISTWKESVDQRLDKMEQEIKDLKADFSDVQKAIVGKIGEYDKNLTNVGGQLSAMEKAFSKVLPQFTENINELNRITQDLKK